MITKLGISIFVCVFLICPIALAEDNSEAFKNIRVAVRFDAAPFSSINSDLDSKVLDNYSGFIVEICREVLAEIVKYPPFQGAEIIAQKVSAADRFTPLQDEKADILCGPTSITKDRILNYNISAPIFLSGIAKAQLQGTIFPKSLVCDKSLVGYVTNTTAENPGIQLMSADNTYFGKRFSPVINRLMNMRNGNSPVDNNKFYKTLVGKKLEGVEFSKVCTTEFSVPPIIEYSGHDKGLSDFCDGKVLFYIADLGIISDYLRQNPDCPVELNRSVAIVENYGVFFKKPTQFNRTNSILKTLALYSSFNRHLKLLLQNGDGVLELAYKRTFGNRQKSEALNTFFQSQSLSR